MGGTEAFPELGEHCQQPTCHQLDFLPFNCDACSKVFCLEHRSYESHECLKADHKSRTVVVCSLCAGSIERKGNEEEETILERHMQSGDCDPSKRKKPKCPVKRCREVLTFSNTNTCKVCQQKVCLKHRYPSEHACNKPSDRIVKSSKESLFLLALAKRSIKDCGKENKKSTAPSVNAF